MWKQRVHTIAGERRRRDESLKLHDAVAAADVATKPILASVPARFRAAQPAGAGRPDACRAQRGRRPRRPALLPDRWRQDRGLPRPDRVRASRSAGCRASSTGRDGARWRGRADALHAAPADAPAVPARRGAALRMRVAAAVALRQGRDGRPASLGRDADADRAVGRPGVDAQPHRGRRGVGRDRPGSAMAAAARLFADAARPLPLVWVGA